MAPAPSVAPDATLESLLLLQAWELRQACRERSLTTNGEKQQLAVQLWQHLQASAIWEEESDEDEATPGPEDAANAAAVMDEFYERLPAENRMGMLAGQTGLPADGPQAPKKDGRLGGQLSGSWVATTAYGSANSDGLSELGDAGDLEPDQLSTAGEEARHGDAGPIPGGSGLDSGTSPKASCAGPSQVPEHFAMPQQRPHASDSDHKIAILINGSRGDVQPCVALAQALQGRGHPVTVFTNHEFLGFCKHAGVPAVPVFASLRPIFSRVGGFTVEDWEDDSLVTPENIQASIERNANDEEAFHAAKAWTKANPGLVQDPFAALVAHEPSLVLFTLQSQLPAVRYERDHACPCVAVYFTTACGAFHSAHCPPRPSLFASSTVVDAWLPGRGHSDKFKSLNIATGPWLLQETAQEIADAACLRGLRQFLARGDPPVTLSWGSMLAKGLAPVSMLATALRALRAAGRRGVVLGGWARLDELGRELLGGGLRETLADAPELEAFAAEHVVFLEHAPHSWLLPRSACIVHHGGAGTTHAAFSARCPQVLTPFFGDQFHFARRVGELGGGVGFQRPLPCVSAPELAEAILEAERMVPSVDVAGRLQEEGGAQAAAAAVEDFLETKVKTGVFAGLAAREQAEHANRARKPPKHAARQ